MSFVCNTNKCFCSPMHLNKKCCDVRNSFINWILARLTVWMYGNSNRNKCCRPCLQTEGGKKGWLRNADTKRMGSGFGSWWHSYKLLETGHIVWLYTFNNLSSILAVIMFQKQILSFFPLRIYRFDLRRTCFNRKIMGRSHRTLRAKKSHQFVNKMFLLETQSQCLT